MLVLIPDARLPQLLPLVRTLWTIDEPARVIVEARQLAELEVGALVVLSLREADSVWLNRNRPIFAQRKLRVVLWGDESLVATMMGRAPDFFAWVSHVVGCPFAVPAFTVRGLRAGVEWGRIAWGGGLDSRAVLEQLGWAFEQLPSGTLRLLDSWARSATGSAPELLESPAGADGWFPVDARQLPLAQLPPHVDPHAAILVELEHTAIEVLARLGSNAISLDELRQAADTDGYLLEQAERCSESYQPLQTQALRMRTAGPLLRALFATRRASFKGAWGPQVPGKNETE
ncbi:MAG TPA: hypothetical protein VK034_20380 [Enhygromyxa sp.]|nr:hypothetical protein [Enhygromyxa sp.]